MNHTGKIAVGLAGALAFTASLRADDVVLPGNPYAPVVARNIFGLNPAPAVDPNAATVEPPVKITPNGIMSIFGQLQVLFKVAGKPGGKDAFYTLGEGQRQDDIEVTKINENKGIVTFNNHGIVQELPLTAAPALNMPVAVPGQPTMVPGIPTPFGGRGGPGGPGGRGGDNNFGGRGRNGGGGNNFNNSGDNNSNLRSVPTRGGSGNTYQPAQDLPQMSPEVQAAQIILNTEKMKAEGNPAAMIMPPVPGYTPSGN